MTPPTQPRFAAAILDLDGTVYRGGVPIPGAVAGVRALRDAGIDVLFVTNKATESRATYAERLTEMGIAADESEILTSSYVTALHLAAHEPDRTAFVIGEDALVRELDAAGLDRTADPAAADCLVASVDYAFDYGTITDALRAMDEDTLFVATNPDRTVPVEDGEIPDTGAIIGAVEGVTGHDLDRLMGKPSNVMLDAAASLIDAEPADCLVVGDRLDTDVAMGERAGMTTALVLTGVTDEDEIRDAKIEPDHVLDSLGAIREAL